MFFLLGQGGVELVAFPGVREHLDMFIWRFCGGYYYDVTVGHAYLSVNPQQNVFEAKTEKMCGKSG